MSSSAKSVLVFGIYLMLTGLVLLVLPNLLLGLFALPPTNEVWIRVVGMLLLFLGVYYYRAARKEFADFIQWTVYLRATVVFFLSGFVALGLASPPLILFGLVDLLGAIWTALSLRSAQPQAARA